MFLVINVQVIYFIFLQTKFDFIDLLHLRNGTEDGSLVCNSKHQNEFSNQRGEMFYRHDCHVQIPYLQQTSFGVCLIYFYNLQ
jgi:hypothetical protein